MWKSVFVVGVGISLWRSVCIHFLTRSGLHIACSESRFVHNRIAPFHYLNVHNVNIVTCIVAVMKSCI